MCAVGLLVLVLLPIAVPFLKEGFPDTHDGATHVAYVLRFDRALHQGQFPVRWVEPVLPGRGQPLFNYYQVGFFYLVAAVHELVPTFIGAIKTAVVMSWWAGAAFMFLLCRRRFGAFPAAAATVVFALSPYLITDVLVRGAFPELLSIVCAMAALWFLDRFFVSGSAAYLAALAVAFATIVISHLLASLVLAPVFIAYLLFLGVDARVTVRRLAGVVAAGVLAVGIAAFYVGPALYERHLVKLDRFTQEALDYRRHFVPPEQLTRYTLSRDWSFGNSVNDPTDLLPLHVSLLEWLLIGSAMVIVVTHAVRRTLPHWSRRAAVWLSLIPLSMFMMSRWSLPIWENLPALAFLQFPWKFFMLIPIACALIAAVIVSAIRDVRFQALAVVGIAILQASLHYGHLQPVRYGETRYYDVDGRFWRTNPEAQAWDFFERALSPIGAPDDPAVDGSWSFSRGEASVIGLTVLDHRLALTIATDSGTRLTLHIPYFPGWVVRVDGSVVPVGARPRDSYMDVDLAAGTHEVVATFENTPVRAWSNGISVMSVLLMVGAAIRFRSVKL